mgnify:CR=1 FL=1
MNKSIVAFLGLLLFVGCNEPKQDETENSNFELVKQKSQVLLEKEDVTYRDLNSNGKLDIYEDVNQTIQARTEDLLSQMTLE